MGCYVDGGGFMMVLQQMPARPVCPIDRPSRHPPAPPHTHRPVRTRVLSHARLSAGLAERLSAICMSSYRYRLHVSGILPGNASGGPVNRLPGLFAHAGKPRALPMM